MAKPNLAYIPATIGDKVYSILPSDGVGDFDFDRGTIATRINAQGLIETVASGENRLNYSLLDGEVVGCPSLLLEPQSSNFLTYSESLNNWTKQEISVVENYSISPDGTQNADKVIPSAVSGTHQVANLSVISSQTCAMSIFAKSDGLSTFDILDGSSASNGGRFNLSNQSFENLGSGVSSIEDYGNGWYRCTTVAVTTGFRIYCPSSAGDAIGDGVSGVLFWGGQIEALSYSTSYIPNLTTGSTTRAAETCNGSGDAATFNDAEGVLYVEAATLVDPTSVMIIGLSDGTSVNRISITFHSTLNRIQIFAEKNSVPLFNIDNTSVSKTNFNKIAISYSSTSAKFFLNGILVASATPTDMFTANTLDRVNFDIGNGANDFYGKTKQIQYFDSILDLEQLEQLTSWDSFRDMAEGQLYSIQ